MTGTDDLCDFKLCIANPDHPARRFHNLFVRLRHLLTREELAACVVQYADLTQMGDGDEDTLCQMSTLSGDDLQAARAVVTADREGMSADLANARAMTRTLARNEGLIASPEVVHNMVAGCSGTTTLASAEGYSSSITILHSTVMDVEGAKRTTA
jgi:hypothetical protein